MLKHFVVMTMKTHKNMCVIVRDCGVMVYALKCVIMGEGVNIYAPLGKRRGTVLFFVHLSIGRSVDQSMSAQYLLTLLPCKLPNLVQWINDPYLCWGHMIKGLGQNADLWRNVYSAFIDPLFLKVRKLITANTQSATVTWLKYIRYGVKLYPINQSINQSTYAELSFVPHLFKLYSYIQPFWFLHQSVFMFLKHFLLNNR